MKTLSQEIRPSRSGWSTQLSETLKSTASSWVELDAVAQRAGVPAKLASMARAGKPVNAGAHLALCAAVGIDPVDGTPRPEKAVSPNIVWWLLSAALYITRHTQKLDQRSAATAIGISPATVCRVELGQPVSIGVMLKICGFIGVHPFGYTAPLFSLGARVSRETCTETRCDGSSISRHVAEANEVAAS